MLSGSVTPPEAVTHCFDMQVTAWSPALQLGEDAIFITLPSSIALTNRTLRITESRKSYAVVPARGQKAPRYTGGYWYPVGDQIKLVWGSGFSGMEVILSRTKSGLEGPAKTYWDFPRPVQTSHVIAKEVRCMGVATGG